jgi:pentose-5-phosphate-3-epimerase
MHPEEYLDLFASLKVKRVVIHVGSTDAYALCISHARAHGYRIGLGIMNTTPRQVWDPLISQFDYVQVMGIAHIGVQGQPFDPETLNTVANVSSQYPLLEIAVDGAVNEHTIPVLRDAGVTRYAPGSAIAKAADPVAAYKQLADIAGIGDRVY